MPIYEYRCESCGAALEKLQKISDPPLRDCPECGKDTLVKLVSASSFRLKGSGWYETDFKNRKKTDTAAESDKGGDKAADKADKKGDTAAVEKKDGAAAGSGKSGSAGDSKTAA